MPPEVVTAPPAPAQESVVETPVTVSADVDAARRGDFAAMQESVRATRGGKPLPRVSLNPDDPAPLETAKAGQPSTEPTEQQRAVSKRQQQINDYERRIAEQSQYIADLERRMTAPPERQPVAAEPPPAKETPAYKRYASMPNAPKLNDVDAAGQPLYDTVEEHSAAMHLFIAEQRDHEANQTRAFEAQRARFEAQRKSFEERLAAASKADPDFRSKLAPELLDERDPAVPLALLEPGTPWKFKNLVAQAIWEGADPSRLLPYLSAENSKVANELVKLHVYDILPALHRLDGRLAAGATSPAPASAPAALAPLPSPISAAPPPAPKVTGAGSTANPADTALARGDVSFFIRQEQEKRAAGRRSA